MELSEALSMSLVSTAMIVAVYLLRAKYRRRIRVYGSFAYKLNGSGTLKEIPAASIPSEVIEWIIAQLYAGRTLTLVSEVIFVRAWKKAE